MEEVSAREASLREPDVAMKEADASTSAKEEEIVERAVTFHHVKWEPDWIAIARNTIYEFEVMEHA